MGTAYTYVRTNIPYSYIYTPKRHIPTRVPAVAPMRDANIGETRSDKTSISRLTAPPHLNFYLLLLPPVMISPGTELPTPSGPAGGSGP